jgi:hypothetical protein
VEKLSTEPLREEERHFQRHFQRHFYTVTDRLEDTSEVWVRAAYLPQAVGADR